MHLLIAEKAIDILHNTRGIEKVFILNGHDIEKIMELEEKDELMNSRYFGKKHNIGVKRALMSDILIAFVTNNEYDWPKDNLKITYQGEVIGRDICNPAEIKRYKDSNDHCVFGNIVVNFKKMRGLRNTDKPPLMIINSKPCEPIESMDFISEALVASPSRLTDSYIKSKIPGENNSYIGSFLVGLNLEEDCLKQSTTVCALEN